ncbi:phage integrase SAM-like domain-containing protein [Elizabethkingia argenteiflava]|uniref:phage integrase SAM-like domain-containing protein n=1 Tax=Elizabethkingia argenteiflava TaxID=2681556 RepID=UPI001BB3438E|nr:phage integrase SAM-like domain-containing protein [Elizabethkingia argenteiflava]
MATFKAEVQNKRADRTYNVRIRITHNRIVRRISTNIFITDEDITGSLKIKNKKIIDLCNDLISKCRNAFNEMGYRITALSADELTEALKTHLKGGDLFKLNFIAYMTTKAGRMKEKTGKTYITASNALKRFLNRSTLDISEIDIRFLQNFKKFLEEEPSQRENNRKKDKG